MKAEIILKRYPIKYPYIGQLNELPLLLVLFFEEGKGVVLVDDSGKKPIGYYGKKWNENHFDNFNGEITLSNN